MPANCAYGILNTKYTSTNFNNTFVDKDKAALLCLQCKPGYKPTFKELTDSTFTKKIVTACTPILFCNFSV